MKIKRTYRTDVVLDALEIQDAIRSYLINRDAIGKSDRIVHLQLMEDVNPDKVGIIVAFEKDNELNSKP